MTPENSKKEKFLALLVVIIIFLFAGSILFSISLNNKEKHLVYIQNKITRDLNHKIDIELNNIFFTSATSSAIEIATSSQISSKSFLVLAVAINGNTKIITQKQPEYVLPIASITKLMDAVIMTENTDLNTKIKATKDYIGLEESAFILEPDKTYTVKNLISNSLISSDNDSARLLSSNLGEANFIKMMNSKAQELSMTNTKYVNVTGLDPQNINEGINVSTASDLAKLIIYISKKHPEILKITTNASYNFCDINNVCKIILSTNKILENKDFKYKIIGGKTGTTDLAGKNLILLTEITPNISILSITLGSKDNFTDTLSLINNINIKN